MTDNPNEYKSLTEWASLNLFDAALQLRMSHDGSMDPMSPEDEAEVIAALEARLDSWRPSLWPERKRADNAVREFVLAVLEEVKA